MSLPRRRCLQLATLLALSSAAVIVPQWPAMGDDYPSRTVRIIVPFGAGGPTDVYTRAVVEELRRSLHQTFVIETRPGAGTTLGTEIVAKAPPDGYTLLMVSGTQTVNETLYPHKSYQLMRDLVPIAPLMEDDLVLVAHPSVPAKNLNELIALARAKPGTLNYGSSGPGSNYHMAGELLKRLTGIDIVHVPYKGSTGARGDILGGQIQILFDSVPTMAPMIKASLVRPLGTSGETRSAIMPDVPTLDEAGVPGFRATLWIGLMAAAGTPAPVVDLLNREITKIVSRPDIKEEWTKQGAVPLTMSQPEFKAFMQSEITKWAEIIKTNHIAQID
jgi:tripartite-type tricarboxylate transporter receptor subunit TctC